MFAKVNEKRLVTVIAGAGYGKTTFVIDALKSINAASIWYRLDEQDTDFQVFVAYLYAAVGQHFLKPNQFEKRPAIPKTNLNSQAYILMEWLAFLEKTATQETVIVLDDYHLVQKSRPINNAIEFMLERLAAHIHLVIIGRHDPDLRLSTIRAREQLIEFSEKDLAFTADEVKRFFADTRLPSDTHIKKIHSSTGGWAASLVLLRYTLHEKEPASIARALESFKQTPRYIFSYLKENFFDVQPAPIQTFMMKAALLAEIDTSRCEQIFGVDNAGRILKRMVENHLMIFPVDESETIFYFHHLFRKFLVAQLEKAFSKSEICALHCKIAEQIEKDDIFQALDHFIKGNAFDKAIHLIDVHETRFLLQGKIDFLGRCVEKIPKPIIEKKPQLLLAQARLFSHYGNPRQAMDHITRAHQLFKRQKANDNMIKCLVELGSQYYSTGYIKEAKLLMEQVLDEVDENAPTFIIAMNYLTLLSTALCEFETAERYYRTAREVIDGSSDYRRQAAGALIDIPYTYTLFIKGELEQARRLNEKVLKTLIELNIKISLPMVYSQRSVLSFFSGGYDKGAAYAAKGIEICDKMFLSDNQKGWVYLAWAQNCLGLEKLDKAAELIHRAVEHFEDPGNRWGLANAWDCLHKVYLAQGKIEPARRLLNRAIHVIDGCGLLSTEGTLGNSLAGLLMIEKDFSKALNCLKNAQTKLSGVDFYLFENHLLAAKCHFESGRTDKAIRHLSQALRISESKGYDRFVKQHASWIVPLVKDNLSNNRAIKDKPRACLKRLFQKEITQKPPRLKIVLLGRFKLTIGNEKVPSSRWKSAKALMIFKYLAANRQKGFIPRDVLIEMLWPDDDIRKTGSRFNMAMSALRKTLQPRLAPKKASAYIERKKDTYRLNGNVTISIDTEHFTDALKSAKALKNKPQKALEYYLLAESIYQGPFLEEDRYEGWCMGEKERFASDYLMMLKAIEAIYDEQKNSESTARYNQKILKADPFDENALGKLMTFHAASGNPAETRRIYENHIKAAEEMDCSVSAEITELYKRLTI